MAQAPYLREKVRQPRIERKLTTDELADRLALSRSTIYYWVRDLPIPGSGPGGEFPESARRLGTRAMQRKCRLVREHAYEEGCASFGELAGEPTFRDFVCLYIGEGTKRGRHVVALGNSDPEVVKLAHRWIVRLTQNRVQYGLQYHADQSPPALAAFWANELDIDPERIRLQRKSNSNQLTGRTWRSRYGVLTVRVSDTLLRARLQAWMDCLRRSWV